MIRTLIQMSLGGAVLIAVIILIRLVGLSRLPKRLFPALWCLALLRLLTPLSVTLPAGVPLPALPVPDLPSVESPITPADQDGHTANPNNPPADKVGDLGAVLPGTVPSPAPVTPSGAPSEDTETRSAGFPLVPAVWAAVGLGLGLYFAISRARFCREVRTAVPVENEFATRWLKRQRPRRRVRLRELAGLPSPLTYGIIRPVILVPRGFDWSDADGACYVLYHEYTHIRRFDAAQKLLMAAALCLHWFNPLVWAMYFLLDRDLELSCDEAVLLHYGPNSRRDYALSLIALEARRSGFALSGSYFSKNSMEERIKAIMKFNKITVTSIAALALAMALVIAVAIPAFASETVDDSYMLNKDNIKSDIIPKGTVQIINDDTIPSSTDFSEKDFSVKGSLDVSNTAMALSAAQNHSEVVLNEVKHDRVDMSVARKIETGVSPIAFLQVNIPSLPAEKVAIFNTSFSMEAGETVTINCVYSPSSANVDFGLIAPDGLFYYVPASGGNIKTTFKIPETGNYTLAIRNNSTVDSITVTGFVNY